MKRVISAVERFRLIPESRVDVGIGQREAFLKQLHRRYFHPQFCPSPVVGDEDIVLFREYLSEVQTWVTPNQLPDDYLFFLEYYGGLDTGEDSYCLDVLGIGAMVEVNYSYIAGDDGYYEGGFLHIAHLWVKKGDKGYDHHSFFLDLEGAIHRYSVINLPNRKLSREGLGFADVLSNPHAYPNYWIKIADSFTEWLELAADTAGTFGYVQRQEE